LRILLYRFKFFCIALRSFSVRFGEKKIDNPIQGRVNFSNPFWYLQMQTQNHHTVFAIWSKIGLLLCSMDCLTFFINKSVRSCCFFLKTPPVFYFSVYGSLDFSIRKLHNNREKKQVFCGEIDSDTCLNRLEKTPQKVPQLSPAFPNNSQSVFSTHVFNTIWKI